MPLSLELNVKCRFCGGKLLRNSVKQNIYYCSKECRSQWRNKKRKEDKKRNRERERNRSQGTQVVLDVEEKTETQMYRNSDAMLGTQALVDNKGVVSGTSLSSESKPCLELRQAEKKTVTQFSRHKKTVTQFSRQKKS